MRLFLFSALLVLATTVGLFGILPVEYAYGDADLLDGVGGGGVGDAGGGGGVGDADGGGGVGDLLDGVGGGGVGDAGGGGGGGVIDFDPIGKSIEEIFLALLDIILVFAVPIIIFFIVWAGFLYVTAAGDTSKVQQATTALTYAIIGGLLVLGAKVLLAVITNTIKVFT